MEILFKVGDSGGYRDGDIITVKPDGWLISSADMSAYIEEGKEPRTLAEMPAYLANQVRRRVLAIRWKQCHSVAEIMVEYRVLSGWPMPDRLACASDLKSKADADAAQFATNGFDTNWGTEDLKIHGVMRIADLSAHQVVEFLDSDWLNDHTNRARGKRRYGLLYSDILSSQAVGRLRDTTKRVDVDRTTIMPLRVRVGS